MKIYKPGSRIGNSHKSPVTPGGQSQLTAAAPICLKRNQHMRFFRNKFIKKYTDGTISGLHAPPAKPQARKKKLQSNN